MISCIPPLHYRSTKTQEIDKKLINWCSSCNASSPSPLILIPPAKWTWSKSGQIGFSIFLFIYDLIGLLRLRLWYGLIVYFPLNSFERELHCLIALPPHHQGIVFPIKVFTKNCRERERDDRSTFIVQHLLSIGALPPLHFQTYMVWIGLDQLLYFFFYDLIGLLWTILSCCLIVYFHLDLFEREDFCSICSHWELEIKLNILISCVKFVILV